jgi:hypothetical protein
VWKYHHLPEYMKIVSHINDDKITKKWQFSLSGRTTRVEHVAGKKHLEPISAALCEAPLVRIIEVANDLDPKNILLGISE